jgi:hypothetical protein
MDYCEIYSDSQTTLSLLESNRAHREWLRTPSRGWVQELARLLKDNPHMNTNFVKAHTDKKDMISKGNDRADKLAKAGTKIKADPLITLDRGGTYLSFEGKMLVSGIKKDLAKISKILRYKSWSKLQHQGQILKHYKHQYSQIYKNLIRMMLEKRNDKLWSFFILSTLCWITPPPIAGIYAKCTLCGSNSVDNNEHFFACPALNALHRQAEMTLLGCLNDLNINVPVISNVLQWRTERFILQEKMRKIISDNLISHRHLFNLAKIYISHVSPHLPDTELFQNCVSEMIKGFKCNCKSQCICNLNLFSIPAELMDILAKAFSLDTEGGLHPLALTGSTLLQQC